MSEKKPSSRVIIAGGGTGGHIYPALALATALSSEEHPYQVVFFGSSGGPEGAAAASEGIEFQGMDLAGLSGKGLFQKAHALILFLKGVQVARRYIKGLDPLCVIGTGGYASAPACFAAALSGVPLILHEMNLLPGIVTRLLSRRAFAVATAFRDTSALLPSRARVVRTGIPVKEKITALSDAEARAAARGEAHVYFGLENGRKTLLAFGGSQGAMALNEAIWDAAGRESSRRDLQVLHITGRAAYEDSRRAELDERGRDGTLVYRAAPYCERMELAYAVADLAVSRSGAGTCAELAAARLPAVLVPYPYAAAAHQQKNAAAMQSSGGAVVVEQDGDSASRAVYEALGLLDDEERRRAMAEALAQTGMGSGSKGIAALVEELRFGR